MYPTHYENNNKKEILPNIRSPRISYALYSPHLENYLLNEQINLQPQKILWTKIVYLFIMFHISLKKYS
jgi:hypothetical protein